MVPSSRRGKKPPVRRKGGRAALPRKGKWPPRGMGTVFIHPCPSQPCFGGSKGCARVTGKAGENGQHSGEVGLQLTLDKTVGSECGDTLKALAGDQRPTSVRSRVGIVLKDGSGVAIDCVTGRSYYSARRPVNVQSGQRKGR